VVIGMRNKERKTSLLGHLNDLRRMLIISLAAIAMGVLVCYFFLREPLMSVAFEPIRQLGKEPVMLGVAEGFMVQMRLACIAGIILASPIVLWQVVAFILPAFYENEKKAFSIYFFSSVILFIGGVLFSYFYVLKLGLRTFLFDYSEGLSVMISAGRYLSFLETFLIPFGLIFQIPLIACLLSSIGFLNPDRLKRKRRYAILIILIIAAFLTPPDVLSQLMLTLPMVALYEVSILLSGIIVKKKKAKLRARQDAEYQLAKSIYPLK